jgi:hypothetical protein
LANSNLNKGGHKYELSQVQRPDVCGKILRFREVLRRLEVLLLRRDARFNHLDEQGAEPESLSRLTLGILQIRIGKRGGFSPSFFVFSSFP